MYPESFTNIAQSEKEAIQTIVALIERWSGCPFSHFKESTLIRRIKRRLILTGQATFASYLEYLKEQPGEFRELFESLTIKVSLFFRDPEVFDILEEAVLPLVFRSALGNNQATVRIWCAACATGEEAYSVAILIKEFQKNHSCAREVPVSIIASDIDPGAIQKAATGIYGPESLGTALKRYPYYFHLRETDKGEQYVVDEGICAIISFMPFDFTSPDFQAPPGGVFSDYDIIFLRNVLIYYDEDMKIEVLQKVYKCMKPRGFLVLGKSEAIPGRASGLFRSFSREYKIYVREN